MVWRYLQVCILLAVVGGCSRLPTDNAQRLRGAIRNVPQQHRNWKPEFGVLAFAEMDQHWVTVRNVRQCRWKDADSASIRHQDWAFDWDEVQAVDFIVVPFATAPMLAHTMLSFQLADARHLVASVEARLERNQAYSPFAGAARQFELIYVIGDEVDLLGLRAEHRGDEIYVYRSIATPQQSAELLRSVLTRANSLVEQPEFYDTISNNCTTNLIWHINQVKSIAIPTTLETMLPGHSDSFAYRLGLLATELPFEQAKRSANLSMRIRQHLGADDFSQRIRERQGGALLEKMVTTTEPQPRRGSLDRSAN